MDPAELQRRVGTTLREKWKIERLIGIGGMAAVYVGLHRIGRRDALKILHPEAAQRKDVCIRFEREAQAVNRFRHPGAVEIRDIDVAEDGAPFLVMELLEGESLLDRVERLRRIPLDELLRYADETLDVLAAAHPMGIIHRDIKPANLFVQRDGRLKVLDFGLARIRDPDGAGAWTKQGATLGTTPYMPPEQARGRDIDARADLFAVGATMFRLLTGRRIHDAKTDFDLLMMMAKEPAPPIAKVSPELPREVCDVIDRALAFDRERRYPDAGAMLEDVRALRRGKPPPHARRFLATEGVDRAAVTLPRGADAQEPATSELIPVVWSGFSSVASDAPVIDIELPSSVMAPSGPDGSTDRDGAEIRGPEPRPAPAAGNERTMISPGGDPEDR